MKKLVGIALLLLCIAASLPADESKLFAVTRHITKIYIHRLGFRVVYEKTNLDLADFYVPMSWFDDAGGKGILVKGNDASYPYFTVFWEEGEFHSIKLYTMKNLAHETWGNLPQSQGIEDRFNIDEISLEF